MQEIRYTDKDTLQADRECPLRKKKWLAFLPPRMALLHEKRAVVLAPSVIGLCFFVYRIGLGFGQMQ